MVRAGKTALARIRMDQRSADVLAGENTVRHLFSRYRTWPHRAHPVALDSLSRTAVECHSAGFNCLCCRRCHHDGPQLAVKSPNLRHLFNLIRPWCLPLVYFGSGGRRLYLAVRCLCHHQRHHRHGSRHLDTGAECRHTPVRCDLHGLWQAAMVDPI